MPDTDLNQTSNIFNLVASKLADSDAFASVTAHDAQVRCDARHCEEECYYAASAEDDGFWVGWYTPDRWLSESVEADLVHTGDKIEELIEDECVDQGLTPGKPEVQHFRNDDKVFVFRSKIDLPSDPETAADLIVKTLLAYQACFIELGDMGPDEGEH